MKLSSFLCKSRHGIYYFRWQLPGLYSHHRPYLRMSLRTRCPNRAGDLARFLASYGRLLEGNAELTKLRLDEIRAIVREHFSNLLEGYVDQLNAGGVPHRSGPFGEPLDLVEEWSKEISFHEDAENGDEAFSGLIVNDDFLESFRKSAGLTQTELKANREGFEREVRRGRRDMLKELVRVAAGLEEYSFRPEGRIDQGIEVAKPSGAHLEAVINDFIAEHSAKWPAKTTSQVQAYLNVLVEFFGKQKALNTITKQDASDLKKVLLKVPARRKSKPELKVLPLAEVIKVEGYKRLSPTTVNSHIDAFRRFFDWAERHGHTQHKLFANMKVPKVRKPEELRKPFSHEQMRLMHTELVNKSSRIVTKTSHKWASLLGLYTGARLNEICQLDVGDVKCEDDIWFIDINDDGNANKRLKASASKRRVPIHSALIDVGFIEYAISCSPSSRLFPDYSYTSGSGYGRNLGRWFNEQFLNKLGLKEKGLVFHSLRHTMVTRLAQAGVAQPIIQSLVGHAQEGVTQQVYFREGYTLAQLKDAVQQIKV